jgi:hypothetical protein
VIGYDLVRERPLRDRLRLPAGKAVASSVSGTCIGGQSVMFRKFLIVNVKLQIYNFTATSNLFHAQPNRLEALVASRLAKG